MVPWVTVHFGSFLVLAGKSSIVKLDSKPVLENLQSSEL
jgi:hypothetical protein